MIEKSRTAEESVFVAADRVSGLFQGVEIAVDRFAACLEAAREVLDAGVLLEQCSDEVQVCGRPGDLVFWLVALVSVYSRRLQDRRPRFAPHPSSSTGGRRNTLTRR